MLNEKAYKAQFYKDVLVHLIEKYEGSKAFQTGNPAKQRPQVSFKRNNPFMKDYLDRNDYHKRDWMHDTLIRLQQQGIISIVWMEGWEEQSLLRIHLNLDRLDDAYAITNLVPRLEKINRLLVIFKPLLDHPWGWLQQFARGIIEDMEKRKQSGFNLNKPKVYHDVVEVLQYLPEIEGNMTKKALSRQIFADVNHFEEDVEQPFITFLNRAHPISFTSNKELLAFFGVVEEAKLVQLAGAVEWTIDGNTMYTTDSFVGGVGITNQTVKQMEITSVYADKIILIENLTSYEQWNSQRLNERELKIYTGGYPHLLLQRLLKKLSRFLRKNGNEQISVYYWGDIDIDSISIYEYMKVQFFSDLEPILMDKKSLLQFKENTIPTTEAYEDKLTVIDENSNYAAWEPVLKTMLQSHIRLEQESIRDVSQVKVTN